MQWLKEFCVVLKDGVCCKKLLFGAVNEKSAFNSQQKLD